MMKNRILALALAFLLMMTCFAATAETETVTGDMSQISSSQSSDVISYTPDGGTKATTEGLEVEFIGNVTSTGNAVYLENPDSDVTITGDVTTTGNKKNAVAAYNGAAADVTGDVSGYDAVYAKNGGTIEVEGDVTATDEGVWASGANSSITLTGDVTVSNPNGYASWGVDVDNGGHIEAEGDVTANWKGVNANGEDSYAYVNGDVTATGATGQGYYYGVYAYNNGTAAVEGDVTATAAAGGMAVYAADGGNITVDGDVTGTVCGTYARNDSSVVISGDAVATEDEGYAVQFRYNDSTIVVEGTAQGEYAMTVCRYDNNNESGNTLIVGSIEGKLGIEYSQGITEATGETEDYLVSMINYIVTSELHGTSLEGTTLLEGYDTAKEAQELTVSGEFIRSVSAGQYAGVTRNSDGTYTITVNRGGDLDIIVLLEQVNFKKPAGAVIPEDDSVYRAICTIEAEDEAYTVPVGIYSGYEILRRNIHRVKILLDEEQVDKECYELKLEDGQLNVTFTPEFIAALAAGDHRLDVNYESFTYTVKLVK